MNNKRIKNIFLIILLIPLFGFSQNDSLNSKGIEFNTFISNRGSGVGFNPGFFFTHKKHTYSGGLVFTRLPAAFRTPENNNRLTGFHIYYQYRPNSKTKRLNFYFRYDFVYAVFKDFFLSYTSLDNRVENYIGYGFKFTFAGRVFISHSMGFGAHYLIRKFDLAGTPTKSTDLDRATFGLIGIGFDFKR